MDALYTVRGALLAFLAAHHYPALFLVLLAEEAGVPLPLPGNALVMYEGGLVRMKESSAYIVLPLVWLAVTLGSLVPYWLAQRHGQAAVVRYGRYLRIDLARVERMASHYRRWGAWAIIVGRLVPWVRVPTTIAAGIFAVPWRLYVPCTAFAAALWTLAYFSAGLFLERPVRRAIAFFQRDVDLLVTIIAIAVILAFGLTIALRRQRQVHASRTALETQHR